MGPDARTPEELDTLLQDAFVVRDGAALPELFEDGAVLPQGGRTYVAEPRRVVQARAVALVISGWDLHVARRGGDGSWRYANAHLSPDDTTAGGTPCRSSV